MSESNNQKKESPKDRIGYGVKPPILTFEEVIEITKIIIAKGGDTNSLDVLSRITGNSRSSSTFNQKVAALKVFGVINTDKNDYTLTELGRKIATPYSFESQANSIIEAFAKNDSLKKIWDFYKGKRLPQKEFLTNSIVNILSIPQELKTNWTEYFISAGEYAGLLEERETGSYQVLSGYSPSFLVDTKNNETFQNKSTLPLSVKEELPQNNSKELPNIFTQSWGIYNMKTISNNRKAIFAIPENLTQQDIDSLRIVIKGIDVQLDGLKKNEE